MTTENEGLIRRWFEEVWNQGMTSTIDALLDEGAVVHGLGADLHGPDDFKTFHAMYRSAFPDMVIQVDDVAVDGPRVAARWSGTATHRGELMGIPPTGRRVTFTGMVFIHVERGKVVEGWNNFDQFGLLLQLGAVTQPGAAVAS